MSPCPLSLGRVDPAPHTQHLLGPFEAIAQNSSLRSFSIVDSLANRQHSCRGSEELAIRKTARFQATPSNSEQLRATPSYSEWGAPKNSELLRATPSTPSGAQELRATTRTHSLSHKCVTLQHTSNKPTELLRAGPKHSELFRATPSCSQPFRASKREYQAPWKSQEAWYSQFSVLRTLQLLRATPSYSELLRVGGAQELQATPSCSQKLLRAASPEPAVSKIASSSEPLQECCLLARESTIEKLQSAEF